MSDPVVHITNGVPDSGTGNITTLGQTLVDGADVNMGATTDAVITAGASGSVSAKLRAISRDVAAISAAAIPAGTAIIGQVGIDQTTQGTTNGVQLKAGTALAGIIKVGDGTNSAAIKAASTAPVATDPAMVVALSPNGINLNGQATMANSAPVVIASNQASIPVAATLAAETTKVIGTVNVAASQTIGVTNTPLTNFGAGEYETVAASQTAQVLGATGAVGDFISGILVIPATTSPGVVTLLDNATSIPVFVGGATSLATLHPFFIPLGMISVSGAWKITTGANVSCIGIGNFT